MSPDAEAAYHVLRANKQNVGHESGLHLQSIHLGEAEINYYVFPAAGQCVQLEACSELRASASSI